MIKGNDMPDVSNFHHVGSAASLTARIAELEADLELAHNELSAEWAKRNISGGRIAELEAENKLLKYFAIGVAADSIDEMAATAAKELLAALEPDHD